MKFKLDENLGKSIIKLFKDKGLDVVSVLEQGIVGCSDDQLYNIAKSEKDV